MRLLLDTSTVLWWFAGDTKLSSAARSVLSHDDTTVFVSAASAWEICTKFRVGKLPTACELCGDFLGFVARHRFEPLAISVAHGRLAGQTAGGSQGPVRPNPGGASAERGHAPRYE